MTDLPKEVDYYYTKYPEMCCNFKNIKPFMDNIGEFEYHKLAEQFSKLYKGSKYTTFIKNFVKNINKLTNKSKYTKVLNIKLGDLYLNYLM